MTGIVSYTHSATVAPHLRPSSQAVMQVPPEVYFMRQGAHTANKGSYCIPRIHRVLPVGLSVRKTATC